MMEREMMEREMMEREMMEREMMAPRFAHRQRRAEEDLEYRWTLSDYTFCSQSSFYLGHIILQLNNIIFKNLV